MQKALLLFLFATMAKGTAEVSPVAAQARVNHSVQNLESEVSYLKQKIDNQEARIETLREEISKLVKATKELTASHANATDAKVQKVEKNLDKLVSDMKQFKTYSNETSDLLKELQKAVAQTQDESRSHVKQMEGLETATKSLAKAMQSEVTKPTNGKSYIVKKGDSLEKIAREFATTAQAIKEANGLSSNTIRLNQELQIP